MKNPFTKEAAKIILPFVKVIKKLEVLKKGKAAGAVMLLVYTVAGGATCFTFLSKDAFFRVNRQQRRGAAYGMEITQHHDGEYIVKDSTENFYLVRPNQLDRHQRCECPNCFDYGVKCKHQIAVAQFKKQEEIRKPKQVYKKNKQEWLVYCEIVKSIVSEDIEALGIKVILAEVEEILSIVTNKGWVFRDFTGWSIRTRAGKTFLADSMDDAIAILALA